MSQRLRYLECCAIAALMGGLVFSGCEFGGPGAGNTLDPAEREALLEQWKTLSEGGLDPMNLMAGEEVAGRLARAGSEQLLPLLEMLGDAESAATAKVFATSCLTPFMTADLQDPVIALTALEQDATTRACAVRLLGLIPTPKTTQCLWSLVADGELRVRFEAHMMLVLHGEMDILTRFPDLWRSGTLSEEQRTQLILMLPGDHATAFMPVLREAVTEVTLDLLARQHALALLAQEGNTEADLAALQTVLEEEPDTILAQAVEQVLQVLKQRITEASSPSTAQKEE